MEQGRWVGVGGKDVETGRDARGKIEEKSQRGRGLGAQATARVRAHWMRVAEGRRTARRKDLVRRTMERKRRKPQVKVVAPRQGSRVAKSVLTRQTSRDRLHTRQKKKKRTSSIPCQRFHIHILHFHSFFNNFPSLPRVPFRPRFTAGLAATAASMPQPSQHAPTLLAQHSFALTNCTTSNCSPCSSTSVCIVPCASSTHPRINANSAIFL